MTRRFAPVFIGAVVALAGCSVAPDGVDVPGADVPAPLAATPIGDDTPAVALPDGGLDGGEPTPPAVVPAAPTYGPGLSAAAIAQEVQALAEAEAWLAQLEVEWDNGMTYSEIFRAWRSVSAETAPRLAGFEMPSGADETQTRQLEDYFESVRGAHDEWQSTVDFIVTYITNYTPEILITKAYQDVERHLREAARLREALEVAAPERPEIVIDDLVDL